jgi:hypothetical protein
MWLPGFVQIALVMQLLSCRTDFRCTWKEEQCTACRLEAGGKNGASEDADTRIHHPLPGGL